MNNTFQTLSGMIIAVRTGVREVAPGETKPLVVVSVATGDQIPVMPAVFNNVVGYQMSSGDYRALIGSECYYDRSTVKSGELFAWNRNSVEEQKANRDLNVTNLVAIITTERADAYLSSHCKPITNEEFDALVGGTANTLPKGMTEVPEDDIEDAEVIDSTPTAPKATAPAKATAKGDSPS